MHNRQNPQHHYYSEKILLPIISIGLRFALVFFLLVNNIKQAQPLMATTMQQPVVHILLDAPRYDEEKNRYTISVSISRPGLIDRWILRIEEKETDKLVRELAFTVEGRESVSADFDGRLLVDEREYVIKIEGVDYAGKLIQRPDENNTLDPGERTILATREFKHQLPKAAPITASILSVNVDFANGLMLIDLDISDDHAVRVSNYTGWVIDKESGARLYDIPPGVFTSRRLQEKLPTPIAATTTVREYELILELTTKDDQKIRTEPRLFKPTPPPPPGFFSRLNSNLSNNPMLLTIILLIVFVTAWRINPNTQVLHRLLLFIRRLKSATYGNRNNDTNEQTKISIASSYPNHPKRGITYLDFDLSIETIQEANSHYRARVLYSPVGQESTEFVLAFSELELENFFLRIGRPRRGVRYIGSPEMEIAKNFGGRLFNTIFSGPVQHCFLRSLDIARQQEKGLRLRLHLNQAPILADLPWEYIFDPKQNRFLAVSAITPIVRFLDLSQLVTPLSVQAPLKILVMISSPRDHEKLNVEEEWRKIHNSLARLERQGMVQVKRLGSATLTALQQELRRNQYHIFHFVGHGGFDHRKQSGTLALEDNNGLSRLVDAHYLGALLHDHFALRLVLLNACEGARSSRHDPFSGVAQHLIQQGIPSVIAMQFEITDNAAIMLAQEFYGALADGYPVEGALTEARKALLAAGNDIEWGTPVLYLRTSNGQIFDIVNKTSTQLKNGAALSSPIDLPSSKLQKRSTRQTKNYNPFVWLLTVGFAIAILSVLWVLLDSRSNNSITNATPTAVIAAFAMTPSITPVADIAAAPLVSGMVIPTLSVTPSLTPSVTATTMPSSTNLLTHTLTDVSALVDQKAESFASGIGDMLAETPFTTTANMPITPTNLQARPPTSTPVQDPPTPTATMTPTVTPTVNQVRTPTRIATPGQATPSPTSAVSPSNTGNVPQITVSLLAPGDGNTLNDRVTLNWAISSPLPTGYAFEPIFWQGNEDPMKDGRGYGGTTKETNLGVTAEIFRALGASEGEYYWGILLVNEPYKRVAYLGGKHVLHVKLSTTNSTPTVQVAPSTKNIPDNAQVALEQPDNGDTLIAKITFRWTPNFTLPEGYAFEPVFLVKGESAMRGLGYGGTTDKTEISLGSENFSEPGDYFWGVLLVKLTPYERIKVLSDERIIRVEFASSSSNSSSDGNKDR